MTGDDLEARRRNRASLMASVYMLAGTLTVLFGWSLRLVVLYLVGGLVAGMGLGAALVLLAIAAGRRAGRGN